MRIGVSRLTDTFQRTENLPTENRKRWTAAFQFGDRPVWVVCSRSEQRESL